MDEIIKIKGTAVRIVPLYIKRNYPELYGQWLELLPRQSRVIFEDEVYPSSWFSVREAAVIPVKVLAQLLDLPEYELAFEIGRYSGQYAFKGVYKIFVSISSVSFLIKRASSIVRAYYQGVETSANRIGERQVELSFGFIEPRDSILLYRIKGWVFELILFTQKTEPKIELEFIPVKDDLIMGKFLLSW